MMTELPKKKPKKLLMAALPLVVVAAGLWIWLDSGRYEETDNAAFQQAVTRASGIPLALDGDLVSYAGGTKLMDIRKVNYVILGGDNAGEHLLM